jgi:hypothetical protein
LPKFVSHTSKVSFRIAHTPARFFAPLFDHKIGHSGLRRPRRPAAQKAVALKDRHKFKTEMDAEALQAMFPHLKVKVA